MPSPKPLGLLAPLLAALVALPAPAADRALLIGGGQYQSPTIKALPGIDIDIAAMRRVAANLGFAPADTRVLLDQAATLSAVQGSLRDWLRDGVGPDDRVLIYFSGHGAQVRDQNGDETDTVDEALVAYDSSHVVGADGEPGITDVLLDDDFGRLLAAIPSRDILVLVDACFSGTVTRSVEFNSGQSGTFNAEVKFLAYPGMPQAHPRGMDQIVHDGTAHYSAVSAAGDDEKSLATIRGSLFTQGLAFAIGEAVRNGASLTPRQVKSETARFIEQQLGPADKAKVFHPQISGGDVLADKPLRLVSVSAGHGPFWNQIKALAETLKPLAIQANRLSLREGEKLELTVEVPRDGYLNIVGIDPHDTAIVAFPNGVHPANRNNKVCAGRVRIPGDLPFDLPASPPYGPTLMVAFFTDEPVNLFESGDGRRDAKGNMQDAFPHLSGFGTRGFNPTAKAAPVGAAGTLEVTVCPAAVCP